MKGQENGSKAVLLFSFTIFFYMFLIFKKIQEYIKENSIKKRWWVKIFIRQKMEPPTFFLDLFPSTKGLSYPLTVCHWEKKKDSSLINK